MAKSHRYNDFKKWFEKQGVSVERTSGTHIKMRKKIGGKARIYIVVAKHGRMVMNLYLQKARRRFQLDKISDDDFFF